MPFKFNVNPLARPLVTSVMELGPALKVVLAKVWLLAELATPVSVNGQAGVEHDGRGAIDHIVEHGRREREVGFPPVAVVVPV